MILSPTMNQWNWYEQFVIEKKFSFTKIKTNQYIGSKPFEFKYE